MKYKGMKSLQIIFLLLCVSCYPIIRVDVVSDKSLKEEQVDQREITRSPKFSQIRPLIKTLQISAPQNKDQKISINAESSDQNTLISETYELWTSEIEKYLVENGFKVISAPQSENTARTTESKEQLTKADAIIQINSLKFNPAVSPDQLARTQFEYFMSDESGRKKDPVKLTESQRLQIEGMIKTTPELFIANYYMGEINLKVIYVNSGEVVWFYKAVAYSPQEETFGVIKENTYYLFNVWGNQIKPFKPYFSQIKEEVTSDKSVRVSGTTDRQKTIDRAKYRIIRLLCSDFVKNFMGKY